ncbi:MAG: cytochrome P450 [Chloroflexi bacterium]|nr:cytochrome P450 [Chloroflexota bacterium]
MFSESAPTLPGHWLWGNLKDFKRDNLSFIESAARAGDIVRIRFGPMGGTFLNHPDYVCQVLAARSKSFRKPAVVKRALNDILGENIFTSNGAAWKRSRQALQPAFHRRHVDRYAQIMLDCAERELRGWLADSIVDLEAAMIRVTMNIIAKTMFDADLGAYADELTAVFTRLFHLAYKRMATYALIPNWLPTRENREVKRLTAELRNLLRSYIAEWRAGRADNASLLNLVLAPEDGPPKMSDEQLINEAITIIGAGYETTAYTLVFTWLAMMQNPSVVDRVCAEVDEVIGTRALTLADLPAFDYTERVVKEALRLYPSAWGLSRSTLEPVEIAGVSLKRNSMVLVSPWTLGRDPRWFPDPLRFDPDRHLPENAASIPHYAYIPFGGGGRTCLGIRFALMEAVFIIAMIAQRFRLAPVPGSASGPKSVAFTLRPNGPLRVKLSPRNEHANTRFKPNSSRPFLCNTQKGISLCPHFG